MRSILATVACAAVMLMNPAARAEDGTPKTPGTPPTPSEPVAVPAAPVAAVTAAQLTRVDAEAWLDGFMSFALPRGDLAGAVVVIVKDGQVLLQKGYGYADVEKRTPVDPATTLFRPGSVSKLFTWTAVMQMVEQGKVDLDADVNQYLDFRIPERDGKPITLRNILTHTPGFEEHVRGLMGDDSKNVPALGEILKAGTPQRVYGPGETPAYSNYATALAGYIVERVSGMTFDDYLDAHIFKPLDMQYASFRQPLPANLEPHMSKGYLQASMPAKPFEIVGPAPAGSLSASGADMANFMIAHLQNGKFGDTQILEPETAQLMHGTALDMLPRLNRMMLGFYETNYNGHRVIAHGGDTQWFHSYLHLFLDDNIGLFVSTNSAGKDGASGGLRSSLFEQFTDRYLPGDGLKGEIDDKTAAEHARMIAGRYDNSRRMESSFFSLLNLVGTTKIVVNEDNTISSPALLNLAGVPTKFREVEPFVWQEVGGKHLISAKVANGKVVRWSFEEVSPFMIFEPTPALTRGAWLLPTFVVGLGALLLTALAWPVTALVRRHYGVSYPLSGDDAKAHRWVRIAAIVTLAFVTAWGVTVVQMMSNLNLTFGSMDIWLWLLQILSLFVFFGAAAVGLWNARVVVRSNRTWYAKTWAIVLAVGFVTALWVALAYRLIAFDVNY
jgi:CubicO group peptidase (beta-lactamase class C family)